MATRIGKTPIKIPQGVKITVANAMCTVEGPKGKLTQFVPELIRLVVAGDTLTVQPNSEDAGAIALQGVNRTVFANMIQGVSAGFVRDLEIIGVGYKAAVKGNVLCLNLGYSHQIDFQLPVGISAKVDANTKVQLAGSDKVKLGMVAAEIRALRPPEPYQGKGVKYANEKIIRKAGKAAGSK